MNFQVILFYKISWDQFLPLFPLLRKFHTKNNHRSQSIYYYSKFYTIEWLFDVECSLIFGFLFVISSFSNCCSIPHLMFFLNSFIKNILANAHHVSITWFILPKILTLLHTPPTSYPFYVLQRLSCIINSKFRECVFKWVWINHKSSKYRKW